MRERVVVGAIGLVGTRRRVARRTRRRISRRRGRRRIIGRQRCRRARFESFPIHSLSLLRTHHSFILRISIARPIIIISLFGGISIIGPCRRGSVIIAQKVLI